MAASVARLAGRFAREALALGAGEVCALLRRGFYLRFPGARFACVGDATLGPGPLHALVEVLPPAALNQKISIDVESATLWQPPPSSGAFPDNAAALAREAAARAPAEGLACLIAGSHNALSVHAQPALEALERWLVGNALSAEAEALVGLGSGVTAPGDDYLGGVLLALYLCRRGAQAASLWRWLQPRLAARTREISAAHLAAAAAGEAEEALHAVLNGAPRFEALSRAGWDGLAGALTVARGY
ncbi:MAG: oxamate carbamoyltransferase subunit AllH family protein [Betaproteobacteria bacterium]